MLAAAIAVATAPTAVATVAGGGQAAVPAAAARTAAPAQVTTCSGRISNAVLNDVLVADADCWIERSRIRGSVSVTAQSSARVVLDRSTVLGDVTFRSLPVGYGNGYGLISLTGTVVRGGVYGNGSVTVTARDSTVRGQLRTTGTPYEGWPTVNLVGSRVNGPTSAYFTTSTIVRSRLADADIRTGRAGWTLLWHATATGDVTLWEYFQACGSTFRANVTSGLALGFIFGTNGPTCGGNTVRGDLTFEEVARQGQFSANKIHGKASVTARYGELFGSGNRFRGGAYGDLASLPVGTVADIPEPDMSDAYARVQAARDAAAAAPTPAAAAPTPTAAAPTAAAPTPTPTPTALAGTAPAATAPAS